MSVIVRDEVDFIQATQRSDWIVFIINIILPFIREYQIIYDVFILCAFDMHSTIWLMAHGQGMPFKAFTMQFGAHTPHLNPKKNGIVPNDLITNQRQAKNSQNNVLWNELNRACVRLSSMSSLNVCATSAVCICVLYRNINGNNNKTKVNSWRQYL